MLLLKVIEKLDKDALKLYTASRFGAKEHTFDPGPPR